MADDPDDDGGTLAASTTTVAQVTTTFRLLRTTDHHPMPTTTTTIPTTTTTVVTAESVAGEIGGLLAVLGPPDFRPRDISKVEDRLERILEAWASSDREDLIRELDRAFEEVADLEESPERDELDRPTHPTLRADGVSRRRDRVRRWRGRRRLMAGLRRRSR